MKTLLMLAIPALLLAQEPAKPEPAKQEQPAKPEAAKPDPKKTEEAPKPEQPAAEQPAEQPTAADGAAISGSAEIVYRWRTDPGGNVDAYRSVVDIGEGVRLADLDLSFTNAAKKWFDSAQVRANGWGGDPYSTAGFDLSLDRKYKLRTGYRNLAYYNFLPSFANPQLEAGILRTQRAFDTRRRLADVEFELFPGRRIVPFFAYARDQGYGSGIINFVDEGNEYPVFTGLDNVTNSFRGGVRIELSRVHISLEQGGLKFSDDERALTADRNLGNRSTPFLGQQLLLNSLAQTWRVRGDSIFSRGAVVARPTGWADVHAEFLFSQPSSDVRYSHEATGRFVMMNTLVFSDRTQTTLFSDARMPHSTAGAGFELRPHRRLRIIESWLTDRLHNSSLLFVNHNRQRLEAIFDLTPRLSLRGGHRYSWGDARNRSGIFGPLTGFDTGEYQRHSGLGGVSWRPVDKMSFHADFEGGSADRVFFRTGFREERRLAARARWQPLTSLSFSTRYLWWNNDDPAVDFTSRDATASLMWLPAGGKLMTLSADYSRSTMRSDITYLIPQGFIPELSRYRDYAHTGTALLDLKPGFARAPIFNLGGSFFVSSGSRPTRYYQPVVRVSVPVHNRIHWTAEWKYYAFTERFQTFEAFRSHLFAVGLRLVPHTR